MVILTFNDQASSATEFIPCLLGGLSGCSGKTIPSSLFGIQHGPGFGSSFWRRISSGIPDAFAIGSTVGGSGSKIFCHAILDVQREVFTWSSRPSSKQPEGVILDTRVPVVEEER